MSTLQKCPRCGATLAGAALPGLCPACLMAGVSELPAEEQVDPSEEEAWPDASDLLPPPTSRPFVLPHPESIGNYRIIENVGEGGMGIVYKAEQRHPLSRIVAIKLVKVGMDSREAVARFKAEQQALALMDHPNVAKVLDAGVTEDGRPYFVMEYVFGQPITEYCDHHKLTTRQRLELFLQACEAVHHAHQKAIIHRDIKPSNILVTPGSGKPAAKVIDFGVAKALSHRLTDQPLITERGKLLGTPEYMSPEQADLGWLDLDTRTDIYSLGVVLYELLTGALPFAPRRLRTIAYDEVRRIIQEEEPPRPSTRITELAADASDIARHRSTDPASLYHELHRELEWIPLKAMSKERGERYRSCSEFADDIHNYLEGRPLIAGPQTTSYRVKKFVRKHSRGLAVAGGVLGIILGLLVALTIETRHAISAGKAETVQRQRAEQETAHAQRAEHDTLVRFEKKLIAVGDTFHASSRIPDAEQNYLQAIGAAREAGLSVIPILARLYDPSRELNPLMGSADRDGGVGGFAGTGQVNSIAITHDGRKVLTGGGDRNLILWDLRTGAKLHTFEKIHKNGIAYVALSPDDRLALSASGDHTIALWDLSAGSLIGTFTDVNEVWAAAFSPDGASIFSTNISGFLKQWDVTSLEEIRSFPWTDTKYAALAISKDGSRMLSGGNDRDHLIRLWDVASGQQLAAFKGHTDQVNSIVYTPDERMAVSGSFDHSVRLWDLSKPKDPGTIIGKHAKEVWRVAVSPDGKTVVSGSEDATVRLWSIADRAQIRQFPGQMGKAMDVKFTAGGSVVAASGDGSLVRTWAVADPTVISNLPATAGTRVAISNDGVAMVGTEDGRLAECDGSARRVIRSLGPHIGGLTNLCIAPDGRSALSAGAGGTLLLWDLGSGAQLKELAGHAGSIRCVSFLADGKRAASGGADGTIRIWNLSPNGQPGPVIEEKSPITCLAASPDGSTLLCGTESGSASLWDITSGSHLETFAGHVGPVHDVEISPDGHTALIAENDGTIDVCNIPTRRVLQALHPDAPAIYVSILADDVTAISLSSDGTLTVWELPSGARVRTAAWAAGHLDAVAFSPDARWCAESDGTSVRVLDLSRAAIEPQFETRLPEARTKIERRPDDPAALAAFGEWYAFRGMDSWAIDLLIQAETHGQDISPLTLARCYWRLGRMPEAARQFRLARSLKEAPEFYLNLCLSAVSESATQPSRAAPTR